MKETTKPGGTGGRAGARDDRKVAGGQRAAAAGGAAAPAGGPGGSQPEAARRKGHKRGDGEGLIRQRPNGLWEARLMVGAKPDGRPDVRTVYGKTQAETRKKLDDLRRRHQEGAIGDARTERQTVAAFLERWIGIMRPTVATRTGERYAAVIRLHLAPILGKHRLGALRAEHVQRLYAAKLDAGVSPNTVRYIHAVLRRALDQAVRWGELARNVSAAVDPPAPPHRELHPPTADDLRRLLDAAVAAGDPLHPLYALAILTGCRQGELLGLQWEDVSLDGGALTINRTLVDARGKAPRFGKPKTPTSRRTLKLRPDGLALLREHRARQLQARLAAGPDWSDLDLVFCASEGTPLIRRNVTRSVKAALRRAGLPETIRFHDLRHAAATIMLAGHVPAKVAAGRLGHADVRTTLNIYSHLVPELDDAAAAALERAVPPRPRGLQS